MTNEAMNTCDAGVGGASGEDAVTSQGSAVPVGRTQSESRTLTCPSADELSDWSSPPLQAFPDSKERFPKLSRCPPSIVVEPMEGGDVESGELRWPPDDVISDVTEEQQQQTGESTEGAEPQELLVGGV